MFMRVRVDKVGGGYEDISFQMVHVGWSFLYEM